MIPGVGARWVRDSWPEDGGAGAQDAWLTSALDVVADVSNAIIREQVKRTKKTGDRDDDE